MLSHPDVYVAADPSIFQTLQKHIEGFIPPEVVDE
jgi:hypothetical protein